MGWSQLGVLVLGLCCAAHVVWGQGYVNIAPGKSYDQSSTHGSRYLSRYATDGDTNSYPRFNSKTEINPYWEVDLGRTYPVHNIILWSLSSSSRTNMFPVNITVDDQHCVTVSSNPTSFRNNSVTCSSVLYGRRLRVTGTGTGSRQLALHEIEILVPRGDSRCDVEGRWGSQCQHHCTNNCGETTSPNFCSESTRNCYDECVAGRWGDRCQNRCGQNCATGDCGLKTGNCSACIAGWYGEQCNKTCPSHSCLLNTCHQTTGRCLACHTGYDGENCTECGQGFSKNTTASCSPCCAFCNTGRCDAITGNCTNGCVAGRWGDQCEYRCGQNCATGNCDLKTGNCSACTPGWYGDQCNTRCPSHSCLLNMCHQTTGRCLACHTGYDGDTCTECGQGFSKNNTASCSPCSAFCNKGGCDAITGNCTNACTPGWYGDQCNTRCPSHSCLLNTCHQKTGRCLACHTGYDGENCTGMKDESSQQSSVPVGSAILGAGLMLTIAVISVLVFLCWKHRSQKTVQDAETVAASSSDPVTAPNNVYSAPPTASPSISPSASAPAGDVTPHEIRDPGNTYEQLRIYSNMVFDREAHSEPEPRGTDATTALSTSEHVHVSVEHVYANTSSATKERKPRKKKAN